MMDFNNLTSDDLAVVKYKCDESLLYFSRFWYRVLRGNKFILNWHHNDICEALESVSRYECEFLNINIPPRFSKTELVLNMIAQGISKNPCGNYLYITASDDLRAEVSVRVREIIQHKYFKQMYGVELKTDQNAKNLWRTKQGGGLKTATIFGQITGFGAGQMIDHSKELEDYLREFEGCIVLDDINKIEDATSLTAVNSKSTRVLFNTIFSRKNSADTPIVNIQQRAGTEDAAYELLEYYKDNDNAISLVYPVIGEKGSKYEGESLWKWKLPMDKILELKENPKTAHTFETQYMQNPLPLEGLALPRADMKFYKHIPTEIDADGKEVLQGWTFMVADTADEGVDHFSAPIAQIIPPYVYLTDAIFDQENLTLQLAQVEGKHKIHNIRKLVVETNNAGAFFKRTIDEKLSGVEVYGQWAKGNKMSRILAMSGIIKYYFRFPENPTPEMSALMHQAFKLMKTSKKEDDAADSLAIMASHLEAVYGLFKT